MDQQSPGAKIVKKMRTFLTVYTCYNNVLTTINVNRVILF